MARFFVYYDSNFASGWINQWVIERIIAYFRDKDFQEVNAQDLKNWMVRLIERKEAFNSVILFAQDLIPNTIIETATSNALVRRYLNAGGRIIWIGDVPFFWQGLPNKEKNMWGGGAQNSVLDMAVQQITGLEPLKVSIKPEGSNRGIRLSWAGNRPVLDPANTLTAILGTSTLGAHTLINAWFKNFNKEIPTSGFVRIWDYIPHDVSNRLLKELYDITTYGIK